MKDQPQQAVKETNWQVVAKELRKFKIKVPKEVAKNIVSGNSSAMESLLGQLMKFDQQVLAMPNV